MFPTGLFTIRKIISLFLQLSGSIILITRHKMAKAILIVLSYDEIIFMHAKGEFPVALQQQTVMQFYIFYCLDKKV